MVARTRPAAAVAFVDTMDCLPVAEIPAGDGWTYEIKLDGYRLEAVKNNGRVTLYSRRKNVLNAKFGSIAQGLADLPDGTILDGELVALDAKGVSNFNLLQNFKSARQQIHYYAFDVLAHQGVSLIENPLTERRKILEAVLPRRPGITQSAVETGAATQILKFVKAHGLEGVIAKRAEGAYEPGKRSGAWTKTRLDLGQEFVVGGYTPGSNGFDALLIGFYRKGDLVYAAKVRAGFVPASRRAVARLFAGKTIANCPFVNVPEAGGGRWGEGLTADKMKECIWLTPELVVRVNFREWTGADHLRHTTYVATRDDKDPRKVVRET